MKDHLAQKLTGYIGLAASVFVSDKSKAQIQYTNLPDEPVYAGQTVLLDLNGDGINDYRITNLGYTYVTAVPLAAGGFGQGVFSLTAAPCEYFTYILVAAEKRGEMIGSQLAQPGAQWYGDIYFRNFLFWQCHNRNNRTVNYIPLRKNIGTQEDPHYNYGWLRLNVDHDHNVLVRDFAINLTPDEPILAGQKSSSPNKFADDISDEPLINFLNDRINIQISDPGLENTIQVFDMLGTEVMERKSTDTGIEINTTNFASGIYIVRIVNSENSVSAKVSVVH